MKTRAPSDADLRILRAILAGATTAGAVADALGYAPGAQGKAGPRSAGKQLHRLWRANLVKRAEGPEGKYWTWSVAPAGSTSLG